MPYFYITTDSGCDLTMDICKANDIIPLCVRYSIGDETYEDEMTAESIKGFYQRMREGDIPHTSQLTIYDFVELWSKLAADGTPIVHYSMSSGLSGTYNNACRARDEVMEKLPDAQIYVIDTLIASLGAGMLCLEASRMRSEGLSAAETAKWHSERVSKLHAVFTTDDLTYFYRGGRVSRTGMAIVHALNIWPILHVDEHGELKIFDKARGKNVTYGKIERIIADRITNAHNQTLYISHSDCPEKAKEFGEYLRDALGFKDIYYSCIGTIIGSHTGPGLVAAYFYGCERGESARKQSAM